jgi:hypothetical protein
MADFHDAELILKLYELRTEGTMRDARKFVGQFNPASFDDVIAIQRNQNQSAPENNAYWRQVQSYWDMAAALVMHDALDVGLFVDANSEPFFLYAKMTPHLDEYKKTFGRPFMPQVGLMIQTHLVAREKYEAFLKRLSPPKQ